jgi:hypothetical protein
MEAGYISALAALAGSAIGALASFATTWLVQHSQTRASQRAQDRARCEALYGEFIREASRLFGDAFEHALDSAEEPAQSLMSLDAVSVCSHNVHAGGGPLSAGSIFDIVNRMNLGFCGK